MTETCIGMFDLYAQRCMMQYMIKKRKYINAIWVAISVIATISMVAYLILPVIA